MANNSTRIVKFWTEYRQKDGEMKGIDWVELAAIGDELTTAQMRVKDITPPEHPDLKNMSHVALMHRWEVVGPAYKAWKDGMEIPETGTPLAAWSALSPEQAGVLKQMGIRTVEEVSELGDAVLEKVRFPNARRLPSLAKSFLQSTSEVARDEEIAELKAQLAALQSKEPKRAKRDAEAAA